jgi:hypothetical protein
MAYGAPRSADTMEDARQNPVQLSELSLGFEVLNGRPDWPALTISVDGANPFADVAPEWRGFDPAAMLGTRSPFIPETFGRRVALHRCTCGEAGCGVIAPVVVMSSDQRTVSWVDFRDYTGVFWGPTVDEPVDAEGRPWDLADIHFDTAHYLAEVTRASGDRSWETPRRQVARLVHERLAPLGLRLHPDMELAWVSPAWSAEGVSLMFQQRTDEPTFSLAQQLLVLSSDLEEPQAAAEDIARTLLSVDREDWVQAFGRALGST